MKRACSLFFGALMFCSSLLANQTPGQMISAVTEHCSQTQGCACYASNIDGFHLTFGNGGILKISPEIDLVLTKGTFKTFNQAKADLNQFMSIYRINELQPFCANFSKSGPGISGFLQSIEYSYLDNLFFRQLDNNGGFCNPYQKCTCEFSMGGNELSPDFLKSFSIEVSGGQEFVYTGGSSAGSIRGDQYQEILVNNLGSVLRKSASEKSDFIVQAMEPLGQYRNVCKDFDKVLSEGRDSMLSLIQELEADPEF